MQEFQQQENARFGHSLIVVMVGILVGQICDLFQPEECRNYFNAAGYGPT
jgi:hypothetical protein